MKKILSLFSFAVILLACNSKEKEDDEKGETKTTAFDMTKARAFIDSINKQFSAKIMSGDSVWVASQYGPDAEILLAGTPPVKGKDILSMWGGISRSNQKDWTFTTEDLQGDENFLIETGAVVIKDDTKKTVDQGHYVVTWKKQPDGSWKLYRDIGVTDPEKK